VAGAMIEADREAPRPLVLQEPQRGVDQP